MNNAVNGIYALTFRGASGVGMGLLELRNGIAAGADATGATYDGTYEETEQDIRLDLSMTVPAGVALVQGTLPRPMQYSVPFHATIPKTAIETSAPILVELPPGPVNVIVRRLRTLAH
jgi:hypothetical protein